MQKSQGILVLIPALVQVLMLPAVLHSTTLVHCTVLVLVDLQLAFRGRRPRTGRLPGLTFSHFLINDGRRVTND